MAHWNPSRNNFPHQGNPGGHPIQISLTIPTQQASQQYDSYGGARPKDFHYGQRNVGGPNYPGAPNFDNFQQDRRRWPHDPGMQGGHFQGHCQGQEPPYYEHIGAPQGNQIWGAGFDRRRRGNRPFNGRQYESRQRPIFSSAGPYNEQRGYFEPPFHDNYPQDQPPPYEMVNHRGHPAPGVHDEWASVRNFNMDHHGRAMSVCSDVGDRDARYGSSGNLSVASFGGDRGRGRGGQRGRACSSRFGGGRGGGNVKGEHVRKDKAEGKSGSRSRGSGKDRYDCAGRDKSYTKNEQDGTSTTETSGQKGKNKAKNNEDKIPAYQKSKDMVKSNDGVKKLKNDKGDFREYRDSRNQTKGSEIKRKVNKTGEHYKRCDERNAESNLDSSSTKSTKNGKSHEKKLEDPVSSIQKDPKSGGRARKKLPNKSQDINNENRSNVLIKVQASVTIKGIFNSSDQIKKLFNKTCVKIENQGAKICFPGKSFEFAEKETTFVIIVSADSINNGKRFVKTMCGSIKRYHRLSCIYSFEDDKRRRKTESNNRPNNLSQDICGDEKDCNSLKDNHGSSELKAEGGSKKNVNQNCRRVKNTREDSVKLVIAIEQGFQEECKLISFLKESMGDQFYLTNGSLKAVKLLENSSICSAIVGNKDIADEIVKVLNKRENIHATSCAPVSVPGNKKSGTGEKRIQKALNDINRRVNQELSNHASKSAQVGKILLNLQKSKEVGLEKRGEIMANVDKMRELDKQENEFKDRISELKESLTQQALVPEAEIQGNVNNILREVGIECKRLSTALPMYACRSKVVEKVESEQVSVILGETGSGKSTQLVQYLLEGGVARDKRIVCTQPRKIAAVTLAERVSTELVRKTGTLVGFQSGARRVVSDQTKIVFSTDHTLLNECLNDPLLSNYSCIIIDEAHERSIYTDLLLGMIKSLLPQRPDLKVMITSATINPEIFIRYFDCSPELRVSGRTFPVKVVYEEESQDILFENYEEKAVCKAITIHHNEGHGDILVFLTSSVEITRCCGELRRRLEGDTTFECFPLHGQLPPEEQRKVFEPLENGRRKIIFATNCAETSITIDGIKFVVDTGVAKELHYDPKKNLSSLGTQIISQSSADQRKGRAGRTASGVCYRLYTEEAYTSMSATVKPELLRVHLGQAVLKLAELGVDARKYSFVDAPDSEALEAAYKLLKNLGAFNSGPNANDINITEMGKWMAKLPFEPQQAYIVYCGHQKDMIYESVVIATLINGGSNLIYRGLNESEEQEAIKTKNQFDSLCGDVFTWLKIYKQWLLQPKREQAKWSREKCINHKVLSFIRQTVTDVREILHRELDITFELDFSEDKQSMHELRRIVFYANLPSLCCYLGHKKAGYFSVSCNRQVHIHPSSSVNLQSKPPQWLVYTQLTITSRAFVRGVTVVEETWIEEAVQQGKLPNDFMKVKEQQIREVYRVDVGQGVFRMLVGPRFTFLRSIEDDLEKSGMKNIVVEADRNMGSFEVFSSSPIPGGNADELKAAVANAVSKMRSETKELTVKGETSGVRLVLGEGAVVTNLFMPHQTNKLRVKSCTADTTEEMVREKFSPFGEIVECVPFKKEDVSVWGMVKYKSFIEANRAMEATNKDHTLSGSLMVGPVKKASKVTFEARMSWCRRPIKGNGTAVVRCPSLLMGSLVGQTLLLGGRLCGIRVSSKNEDELVIFATGQATEQEIKEEILRLCTHWTDDDKEELRVNVIREQVEPCPQTLNRLKKAVEAKISTLVRKNKFSVRPMIPKKGTVNYVAIVGFDNATIGFEACHLLRLNWRIEGQEVNIQPDMKTNIVIPNAIMTACKSKFEKIRNEMASDVSDIILTCRDLKHGDCAVTIQAPNEESLVRIRDTLQKEFIEGYTIECAHNDLTKCLLKKQGIEFLSRIETGLSEVKLVPNARTEKIHIFGSDKSVTLATSKINAYLDKLSKGTHEDIFLCDPSKPVGLMKALLKKYPNIQENFVEVFGVVNATIDFKKQKLTLIGTPESVENAKAAIEKLGSEIRLRGDKAPAEATLPDCVTCWCPVDDAKDLYRLEGCGHCYCQACLRVQVRVCVEEKQFPIVCSKEDCGGYWVWRDILYCLDKRWIREATLVERMLDYFVASSQGAYKFCLSPNCPVAYEVTQDEEGCEFACPLCTVSVCTSCHTPFHAGLSCRNAASVAAADVQLADWRRKNADRCKPCPGCGVLVEKTGGCNKMHCITCRAYFCWHCLASFEDQQACYAHLQKVHGGFM